MHKSTIYLLVCFTHLMCVHGVNKKGGFLSNINNAISHLTGINNYTYNNSENPHIFLKIKPATSLRLTRNELNMLLLEVKHEVSRQMEQLKEELADKGREEERHMSTWSINHAPVYIPYAQIVNPHSGNDMKNKNFLKANSNELNNKSPDRTENFKINNTEAVGA